MDDFCSGVPEKTAFPPPDGIVPIAGPVIAIGSFKAFCCTRGFPPKGVIWAGSCRVGSGIQFVREWSKVIPWSFQKLLLQNHYPCACHCQDGQKGSSGVPSHLNTIKRKVKSSLLILRLVTLSRHHVGWSEVLEYCRSLIPSIFSPILRWASS